MTWLADWDSVIHGTVVFGAAVPFGLAVGLGRVFPGHYGFVLAGATALSVFWLFGRPALPPASSEDAVVTGWLAAALGLVVPGGAATLVYRPVVWFAIAWWFFPAWLSDGGGAGRRVLVAASMAGSVTGVGLLGEWLTAGKRPRISVLSLVPVGVVLALLLQIGGATRFAQAATALAAALAGIALLRIWRGGGDWGGLRSAVGMWASLVTFLGWCGWLFAEISWVLSGLLLLVPVLVWAAGRLRWCRQNPRRALLADLAVAVAATSAVAAVAVAGYLSEDGAGGY
ncbi:hypothetical protein BH23VER1_BH23VER1_27920 [soil metagenome]